MVFKRNDGDGSAYVARQPETVEERMLCDEAVWGCPCEAIGDDGDRQDWATPITVDRPDSATGGRVCKHCQKTESLWDKLRKFFFGG